MNLHSRLLACIVSTIVMAGCNAPANEHSDQGTSSPAQLACLREDVQAVVSNEVKSIFQKGFYEGAGTAILLIDPREISAEFENARASFHDVTVANGPDADTLPTERIVCTGTLQIDESNAKQGQQIVQVPKLRWSIDFSGPVSNPQSSAFTVTLDRGSLADDLRFNGKPIEASRAAPQPTPAEQPAPSNNAAPSYNEGDDPVAAGNKAANDAEDAAADASAAVADAERELKEELAK
jgi:hypothetical protein